MLLMVGKVIRGGICHAIHWYVKVNNKCMKGYDKDKKSPYLKYWEVKNLRMGNVTNVAHKWFKVSWKYISIQ